jgi:uncharacterized membrane protein
VATRKRVHLGGAFGRGLARPVLAYLVIVSLGVWVYLAVEEVQTSGDHVQALWTTGLWGSAV